MKFLKFVIPSILIFIPSLLISQYTDVINSNRPGQSVSAYAVGKNVFQIEGGFLYERQRNNSVFSESDLLGADLVLRYGLFFEALEIIWEGIYQNEDRTITNLGTNANFSDFSRNRLGAKFLIYDPFKNPEKNKPNLYSWRANNKFQWKNLIPAVSIYAGANFVIGDNPFLIDDPTVSPRVMIAGQSSLAPRLVLITNISYDRIGTDFPEWGYIISLSRSFKNPKWSAFIENQGVSSDRYSDLILRGGFAHLFNKTFQVDLSVGGNFKNSPSRLFGTVGASYRFDWHKDELIPIDEAPAETIKPNANKKKRKRSKKKKKKGSAIDF